ncbi:MAG: aminotransferase class I/II-fold pyridoxal phosphate-dependent enzyme [archaeon]
MNRANRNQAWMDLSKNTFNWEHHPDVLHYDKHQVDPRSYNFEPAFVSAIADNMGLSRHHVQYASGGAYSLLRDLLIWVAPGKLVLMSPFWDQYLLGLAAPLRIPVESTEDLFGMCPEDKLSAVEKKLCGNDAAIICSPNNPTGEVISLDKIISLAEAHPDTSFLIDEAYMEFQWLGAGLDADASLQRILDHNRKIDRLVGERPNMVFIRSTSKFYGLAGCVGYAVLQKPTNPYLGLYSRADADAEAAIIHSPYYAETGVKTVRNRNELDATLNDAGFKVRESHANFSYLRSDVGHLSGLRREMEARHILIKYMGNAVRITAPNDQQKPYLFDAIQSAGG